MKIVLIGTGNVASVLGRKLKIAGHDILQVFGRNHLAAAVLADSLGASTCAEWASLRSNADLYILALADTVLSEGELPLQLSDQLVVHTAGSVPMKILASMSANYGVLYPYQSIRKEVMPIPEIPFLVDGNNTTSRDRLVNLARSISDKVLIADDALRQQYHLCAVVTNNFSNYLYVLAEKFCQRQQLDFSLLQPIIDETARRLHHYSPANVQTGPAVRNDTVTLERHLALLNNDPELRSLYQLMSASIMGHDW